MEQNIGTIKVKKSLNIVIVDYIIYIIQSRRSFCASPSCGPRLRLGLQSLGLAQKKLTSTLNDITYYFVSQHLPPQRHYMMINHPHIPISHYVIDSFTTKLDIF
jgi:hypothetical protein